MTTTAMKYFVCSLLFALSVSCSGLESPSEATAELAGGTPGSGDVDDGDDGSVAIDVPVRAATAISVEYDDTVCAGPGCEGGLEDGEFDYVVVGAGAGGGPLAANLARRGFRVLLLEAGGDPGGRLTYQIPAWHVLATEDPAMRWDYYVSHYDDPAQAARDDKLVVDDQGRARGVWYPRGTGVGGSTAMNAMIAVYPHASDWDDIAAALGDEDPAGSWRAENMRRYFERSENNGYMPVGTAGHGFDGWMHTELHPSDLPDFLAGAYDLKMVRIIAAAILGGAPAARRIDLTRPLRDLARLLGYLGMDLNEPGKARDLREGVFRVPQQSRNGRRESTREFILDTIAEGYPLTLKTRALVTNVILETNHDREGVAGTPRAVGVDWIDGVQLYSASPRSRDSATGVARSIRVASEVILSAGAFNTPQLLQLSGIGPRAELESLGIDVVVDSPGVGKNLQDRYEVGVIGETSSIFGDQFRLLKDCSFDPTRSPAQLDASDPCYVLWRHGVGVYTINGSVVGIVKRSDPSVEDPDLFIFGLPGYFKGYWPGYSQRTVAEKKHFSWVVLKAHTENAAGEVRLRSADPRERPDVQFRYFDESGDPEGDLSALVTGVKFARDLVAKTRELTPFTGDFREVYPGAEVESDEDLARFIRDRAWGHHACCTAKIGPDSDPMAVLDGDFRVRGAEGLRVVDASVFPDIPGFFIAVPIYMASEKAADAIAGSR